MKNRNRNYQKQVHCIQIEYVLISLLNEKMSKTTCFICALGAVKNNKIIRREKGLKMKNKRYRKLHIEKISSLILSMQSKVPEDEP